MKKHVRAASMTLRVALLGALLAFASWARPASSGGADVKPPPTADDAAVAFADAVDEALVRAVSTVQESSVAIWNLQSRGDPKLPPQRVGGGSGVLVSCKGKGPYDITNEHVVKGSKALEIVPFDGVTYEARLVDHVPQYDIALLDFAKAKPKAWRAAKFGKSEALVEGQWVIATGNPFFLGHDGRPVATLGVISGLERTIRAEFTYANAIQHDAEVNPGNSGGPLWNLQGELLGINGMISSRRDGGSVGPCNTGASFSIPIHLVLTYFDDLLSEKVTAAAGWLGVDVEDFLDTGRKPAGARIRAVRPESPAHRPKDPKAPGVDPGDVVVKLVLGSPVTPKSYDVFCSTDFVNALAFYRAGERVVVHYLRDGKKATWTGKLAAAPAR